MSFQDVGKPGTIRQKTKKTATNTEQISDKLEPISENKNKNNNKNASSGIYGQLSESILQYQRNVGLLEKINRQIGTKADGPVLQTQFRVQVDVIKQLGSKMDTQIKTIESSFATAASRATYVKLNRDYQRVVSTFKSLQLEAKRRWDFIEAQRREREEEAKRKGIEEEVEDGQRVQMTEYQDRIQEDLIREREAEIRNINKGMHQVNEIYKDLAHLVGNQQEDIDTIEVNMQEATDSAKEGLHHVEKANSSQSNCTIS